MFITGRTYGDLAGKVSAEDKTDIFLVKLLSSDGSIVWTKQWGTDEFCRAYSVAADSSGNIFVTGSAYGVFEGNINTFGDISTSFMTKLNSNGAIDWTNQWGADEGDYGQSVVIDNKGDVLITGGTEGSLEDNINKGYSYDIYLATFSFN